MPLVVLFFAVPLLLLTIAGVVLYGIGVLIWRATHRKPGTDAEREEAWRREAAGMFRAQGGKGPSKRSRRHRRSS